MQTIKYMSAVAEEEEIKLNDTVDSQDVAELMLSILDEVKSWLPTESALAADSAVTAEPPELIVPAMSAVPIAAAPTVSALAPGQTVPAEPPELIVPAMSAPPVAARPTESALAAGPTVPVEPAERIMPAVSAQPISAAPTGSALTAV